MKLNWLVFAILLLNGSILITYAHPDPTGVTVQNQKGVILYEYGFETTEKDKSEPAELFTAKWFYHNFIWILTSIIIAIMIFVGTIVYRENIRTSIFN